VADINVEPTLLVTGSVVAYCVAAVLIVGAIPQIQDDPLANGDAASVAFLMDAILNIGIGIAVLIPVVYNCRFARVLLLFSASFALFTGSLLLDSTLAFLNHPGMALGSVSLIFGVLGDAVFSAMCLWAFWL
jgi:hypothetical protein